MIKSPGLSQMKGTAELLIRAIALGLVKAVIVSSIFNCISSYLVVKLVVQEERDCCSSCCYFPLGNSWKVCNLLQGIKSSSNKTLSSGHSAVSGKYIATPSSYWGDVCTPYFENRVLAVSGKLERQNPETFWFELNHWKELHSSCAVCPLRKSPCWCWQMPAPRCWQQSCVIYQPKTWQCMVGYNSAWHAFLTKMQTFKRLLLLHFLHRRIYPTHYCWYI